MFSWRAETRQRPEERARGGGTGVLGFEACSFLGFGTFVLVLRVGPNRAKSRVATRGENVAGIRSKGICSCEVQHRRRF